MKLKALDQIHVSSVKPDSLRPGEQFEVSDAAGAALLEAHPTKFEQLGEDSGEGKASGEKAEEDPKNKAEVAPANKASTRRKGKTAAE